jgi:hypothetical protein
MYFFLEINSKNQVSSTHVAEKKSSNAVAKLQIFGAPVISRQLDFDCKDYGLPLNASSNISIFSFGFELPVYILGASLKLDVNFIFTPMVNVKLCSDPSVFSKLHPYICVFIYFLSAALKYTSALQSKGHVSFGFRIFGINILAIAAEHSSYVDMSVGPGASAFVPTGR